MLFMFCAALRSTYHVCGSNEAMASGADKEDKGLTSSVTIDVEDSEVRRREIWWSGSLIGNLRVKLST